MKPAERALFEAITHGKADVIAQMLTADKELLSVVDDESEGVLKGDCPIHRACRLGNVGVVNAILAVSMAEKDKAKIFKDKDGEIPAASPLIIAAAKLHIPVVLRLIEVGANVNYVNQKDFGYTAIFFAISPANTKGSPVIVQALIDADADIFYEAKNGKDPLIFARGTGNNEIIEILNKASEKKIEELNAKMKELERKQQELEARDKVDIRGVQTQAEALVQAATPGMKPG